MLRHAGYLISDNRAGGALPGQQAVVEKDTLSCNHCRVVVVMNPDRIRKRFTCPKCNEYCCDWCGAAYAQSFICKPFEQVVEEVKSGKTATPILARDLTGV